MGSFFKKIEGTGDEYFKKKIELMHEREKVAEFASSLGRTIYAIGSLVDKITTPKLTFLQRWKPINFNFLLLNHLGRWGAPEERLEVSKVVTAYGRNLQDAIRSLEGNISDILGADKVVVVDDRVVSDLEEKKKITEFFLEIYKKERQNKTVPADYQEKV